METKIPILWGESDPYTVNPDIYPHLFFLIFQGTQQNSGQAGQHLAQIFMGRRNEAKEDCLGQMGNSFSSKRKGGPGHKRSQDI